MADNTILIEVEFDGKKGFATLNTDALKAGQQAGGTAAEGFGKGFANQAAKLFIAFKAVQALAGTLVHTFAESIAEAAKEQQAIDALNRALINAGRYSEEAAHSFEVFAQKMAATTTLADDQVISLSRLATNFTKTNEEAQRLVAAAADLSAATGKDLETSLTVLGRSLSGVGTGLSRAIPQFAEMSAVALRAGGALALVEQRFGGSAAAQVNTFAGAMANVSKQFGEVIEASGKAFVQSPAVIALLKGLADGFGKLANYIAKAMSGDAVRSLVLDLITLAQMFAKVLTPLERIGEIGKVVWGGLILGVNEFYRAFLGVFGPVVAGLVKLGILPKDIGDSFANMESAASDTSKEMAKNVNASFDAIGSGTGAQSIQEFLTGLQANVESASESLSTIPEKIAPSAEAIKSVFKELDSFGAYVSTGFIETMNEAGVVIGEKVKAISINVQKFLVDSIVQGTQSVVKALQAGKNGFTAFSNAILGIIGNMLIQIGGALIATGIGIDALKLALTSLSGGFAIAAGIALVALGTVLSGMGGGEAGGIGAGGGGGGGGVGATPGATATEQQNVEEQKPKTEVAININGNILDRRESGLEIANIIQEFFDTQDGVIAKA